MAERDGQDAAEDPALRTRAAPNDDAAAPQTWPQDLATGALFWRLPEAIIVADAASGRILAWNPAAERMFGYSEAEARTLTVDALVPAALLPLHRRGRQRFAARSHGAAIDHGRVLDVRARRKNGSEIDVELSLSRLSEPGTPSGVLAVIRDATARRNAERTLQAVSRRHELILRSAGDGIYGLDVGGRATFCNPAAEALSGREARELLGRDLHQLLHHTRPDGNPYPHAECPALQTLKDGAVHAAREELYWRKDGSCFPVEYTSTPIREDGQVTGAVVVFRDISDRKRAAAERERLLREQAVRAEAEALAEIGRLMLEARELDEILRVVTEATLSLTGADCVALTLEQADGATLRSRAQGRGCEALEGLRMPAGAGIAGVVLQRHASFQTSDYLADRRFEHAPNVDHAFAVLGLRSVLAVPVSQFDGRGALLWIAEHESRTFSAAEERLLQRLANQAGLALSRAAGLASERQARAEAEALAEIGRQLSASLELEQILQTIVEAARRLVGADVAFIALARASGELHVLAMTGNRSCELRDLVLPPGAGTGGHVLRGGRPYQTGNYFEEGDFRHSLIGDRVAAEEGLVAVLAIPICSESSPLGVFWVCSRTPRRFDAHEVTLLERLATHAAIAVRNARSFTAEREARARAEAAEREVQALLRVVRRVNAAVDPDDVLRSVLAETATLLRVRRASIAEVEDERIVGRGVWADGRWLSETPQLPRQGTLSGEVIESGRHVLDNDLAASGRQSWPGLAGTQASRALAVPIIAASGEVLGSLNLVDPLDGRDFGPTDLALASGIAGHAGIALQRTRLTAAMQRQAAELNAVLNGMSDAVYVCDADGRIVLTNRIAREWSIAGDGLQQSSIHAIAELIEQGTLLELRDARGQPLAPQRSPLFRALKGETISGELLCLRDPQQGGERWIQTGANPLRDAAGRITGAVAVAQDVTQAHRNELETERSERLRATGQLAAGLAHDLNNILGVAVGRLEVILELARRQMALPSPVQDSLSVVRTALLDAAQTVRRLQTFARPRDEREFAPVRLDEIARDAIELARPRWRDEAVAEGRSIKVERHLQPVPPIDGSAAELREAVLNLLINAVDALPNGGAVTIATTAAAKSVRLSVTDTGTGMTPEVAARIWEPFFTTKQERGTGLGLAMVHGIVERHGGHVALETHLGAGTRVELRFPPRAVTAPEAASPTPTVPARSLRVLVVDDEAPVRETAALMLSLEGHEPLQAGSAAAALALLRLESVDLVLTDYGMPGQTGLELARAIHRRRPTLPVVLLTGWGQSLSADEVLAASGAHLSSKPLTLASLRELIAWAQNEQTEDGDQPQN